MSAQKKASQNYEMGATASVVPKAIETRLLSAVQKNIKVKKALAPSLDQFASDVLANVKWADINTQEDVFFTDLVGRSFAFIEQRGKDECKLEITACDLAGSDESFTVIRLLNGDLPFLLDSLLLALQDRSIHIHHLLHPVLTVKRDANGKLGLVAGAMEQGRDGVTTESFISVYTDRLSPDEAAELASCLEDLMGRVRIVVKDWLAMRNRLTNVATSLSNDLPRVPVHQLSESIQFLRWALDNNFTFLGMREYELKGKGGKAKLTPRRGAGLGLLRDPHMKVLRRGRDLTHMTPEVRKFYFSPDPIIVTKANIKSDIHRRSYMDYIGVKLYDEQGHLTGELRIVGLFTSSAYASKVSSVPLLRQKLDYVLDRSGHGRDSHTGKALTNIIETFPRDELFQISNDQLAAYASEIETLDHSPRVKVLKRVDEFDRFVSLMVFLPRDQFSTDNRAAVGAYLADAFHGRVSAYYPYFTEAPYVRIHFIIGRDEGKTPKRGTRALEADIEDICRRYEDRMRAALYKVMDEDGANALVAAYGEAFPAGYREVYGTRRVAEDIAIIESVTKAEPIAVSFSHDDSGDRGSLEVGLYHLDGPIPLSERVPIFENLGFSVIDERSYQVRRADGAKLICQHMMKLKTRSGQAPDLARLSRPLVEGFLAISRGEAANDGFNELITLLGADWQDVAMLRGLARYLRQINVPYDQDYLAHVLVRYPELAKGLIELFHARFDPEAQTRSSAKVKRLNDKFESALGDIPSLDEDQILRSFRSLLMAAVRTNFYQLDETGEGPECLAFKFDSQKIEGAPEPRPYREIFVYSPKVEGVHLRFGKIARGGLRWSDRHQDFRTEILGLVKAQLVKNTVIVPTGSKGGFVPKDMPENPSREEFMACGVRAYKRFINSLLSVTDNLNGKKVIPPQNTVCYDDDDPYLVVAADKGTASFSDIANEISVGRGFWLGDAFASGGSQGYDHKVMGITARGAFEAVKRHFREMDRNIERQPFTAIGVGDMSGDVFGNGMLLSKALKLVAAFDHRDIFIDPDPDPKTSWVERKRMFDLGRSSWQDYNKKLISRGGGVFSRSTKTIPLSAEMRELLCVSDTTMSPPQLIKAILRTQADLLWFGGIGTYVKGNQEANGDVGDRANDSIRISADELRVRVIGEGANLGITQAGRMDFAKQGGRVNTDAIDNSAGVNSSDLEVNIKIAMGQAVQAGRLSMAERNKVLARMTEDVAKRCLVNNYRQTLTLSLGERRGVSEMGFQQRLLRHLEESGLLNREIEELPEDAELLERQELGEALSRAELASLLGFAKIDLFNQLVESDVVGDKFYSHMLRDYFPEGMHKRFKTEICNHPLAREIVATQLTNDIINRGGSTVALRLCEETGASYGDLAAAYTAANVVLQLDKIYEAIDGLDNKLKGDVQLSLYQRLQSVVRRSVAWFLVNGEFKAGLAAEIRFYDKGLRVFNRESRSLLSSGRLACLKRDMKEMIASGVPEALARDIGQLTNLMSGLDVVLSSRRASGSIACLASYDQALDDALNLSGLSEAAQLLTDVDVYDRWALNAVLSRIQLARRELVHRIDSTENGFDGWHQLHKTALCRAEKAIGEILSGGDVSLSKLIVAVGQVDVLAS